MAAKTTYMLEVMLGASTASSYRSNLNKAANSLQSLNSTASRVATAITAAFAAVNITRAIGDAVETYVEFEQEMANTAAISGATAAQYEQMEEAALAAGRSTVFTATESASALGYMSLAGWDVDTSLNALTPVLRMAAATGAELQTTSDLITDSMSALKLEVGELDDYLNKLVAANNNANTTAEDLMSALIKTGGASNVLGASLDDTVTALGVLANNGVKAEEAGTALNSMLTRISANDTAKKELEKIGAEVFDDTGAFIGLEEALTSINHAIADFSDEQRAQSLKNIAGTMRYSQMSYLLESVAESAEDGVSAWDKLEDKVGNSTGALNTMYRTTTDTLENAQAVLGSATDDMKIRLVDVFADDAKDFIFWLAEQLPNVTDSLVAFAEAHRGDFADALETAGEVLEKVWDVGVTAGTWLINHKGVVVGSITAIATALAALKAVNTVTSLIGFFTGLAASPIGLSIVAIGATAGALIGLSEALEQAGTRVIDHEKAAASLAEHFGEITLSMQEVDALARQIVGEDIVDGATAMLDAVENTADALSNVTGIWNDIQKEQWKFETGFHLDAEDYEKYAAELKNYISGVEQYVESKGYEVHVAASLLFGLDSEQDIEAGMFYAGIEEELAQYGADLSQIVTDAMEDGIIGLDEDRIIQETLEKINSITSAISEAEAQAKFDALMLNYDGTDLDEETFMQLQEDIGEYVSEVAEGAQSAYESAMTEYRAKLKLDETYTQEMFEADEQEAQEAYFKAQGDAALRGIEYMMNTIESTYPELQEGLEQYQEDLTDILSKYSNTEDFEIQNGWTENPYDMFARMESEAYEALKNNPIDGDRDALSELLTQMLPTVQQLEPVIRAYNEAGRELPEEIANFQENWQLLSDLVEGGEGQAKISLTDMMSADGAFQGFLDDIGFEVDETHLSVRQKIDETYQDGFDVSTDLRVNFEVTTSGLTTGATAALNAAKAKSTGSFKIYANAQGGIYDRPILTTFAEEGPEAAVPLDGSDRAKSLWLQAGQILGMFQGGTTRDKAMYDSISGASQAGGSPADNIQVIYSPNITVQGGASEKEVQNALRMGLDDLKAMLEEIVAEKQRVSFS